MNAVETQAKSPAADIQQPVQYSIDRCIVAIAYANHTGKLDFPDSKLDAMARQLIEHLFVLLPDPSFNQILTRYAGRTQVTELGFKVEISANIIKQATKQVSKEQVAQLQQTANAIHQAGEEEVQALPALALEISEALKTNSVCSLSVVQRNILLKIGEHISEFLFAKRSEQDYQPVERPDTIQYVLAQASGLSKVLQQFDCETEKVSAHSIDIFAFTIKHIFDQLGEARIFDNPDKMIAKILKKLTEDIQLPEDFVSALKLIASAPGTQTTLKAGIEEIAAAHNCSQMASVYYDTVLQSLTGSARKWCYKHCGSLEAYQTVQVKNRPFALGKAAPALFPAVKNYLITGKRTIDLAETKKCMPAADAQDVLVVHLHSMKAPKIVEAMFLSSAHRVVVLGDMPEEFPLPAGRDLDCIWDWYGLLKNGVSGSKLSFVNRAVGSGREIVRREMQAFDSPITLETGLNELSAFSFTSENQNALEVRYLEQALSNEASFLEIRTGCSVAWVENSDGQVKFLLLHGNVMNPDSTAWTTEKVGDKTVLCRPLRATFLRGQKVEVEKENVEPVFEAVVEQVVEELPHALPVPVLVSAPPIVETLKQWMKDAFAIDLFDSALAKYHPYLVELLQEKFLEENSLAMLRKLSEKIKNQTYRNEMIKPIISDHIDKLGEILGRVLTSDSSAKAGSE